MQPNPTNEYSAGSRQVSQLSTANRAITELSPKKVTAMDSVSSFYDSAKSKPFTPHRHKRGEAKLSVSIAPDGGPFTLKGRTAWTAKRLMEAGQKGITTSQYPGVRLSEYVRIMRHDFGIQIETRDEPHDGPFPGMHGVYCLISDLVIVEDCETI